MVSLLLVLLWLTGVQCSPAEEGHRGHESRLAFHNEWVLQVTGTAEDAALVADQLHLHNSRPLKGLPHVYRMVKREHPASSLEAATHVTEQLAQHPKVAWAEQQFSKRRSKRDDGDIYNDPRWRDEWYMSEPGGAPGAPATHGSMRLLEAMRQGLTGRGVSVVIVDDGLEFNNSDIAAAYDPRFGYDVVDEDDDPFPRYDVLSSNEHGTKCAGIISMQPNNSLCGVGIAPGASLGAVRLLDGVITDRTEAEAFGVFSRSVDVVSVSWGPTDSGRIADMPGTLLQQAIEDGILHGRGGRGVVYIWASGNGGGRGDNCACDGYAGSPFTLAVGSVDSAGRMPWYGEQCAATVAVTYAYRLTGSVVTTDLHDGCTARFSGTSASAPMVAGIVTLMLQANRDLSWRDVQHLFVYTSDPEPVIDNGEWTTNAAGLRFSIKAGFGLVDAEALVTEARRWDAAASAAVPRRSCATDARSRNTHIASGITTSVTFQVSCRGEELVRHLEHVQLQVHLSYSRRGALSMNLTSPHGTTVPVLLPRRRDASSQGFHGFRLMSVGTWGEDPNGLWTLEISDNTDEHNYGQWSRLSLILSGTEQNVHQLTPKPSQMAPRLDTEQLRSAAASAPSTAPETAGTDRSNEDNIPDSGAIALDVAQMGTRTNYAYSPETEEHTLRQPLRELALRFLRLQLDERENLREGHQLSGADVGAARTRQTRRLAPWL